jgi:hypothetical protein
MMRNRTRLIRLLIIALLLALIFVLLNVTVVHAPTTPTSSINLAEGYAAYVATYAVG